MSVTPSSHVVGIFTDRSAADQAVEALYNAGFGREQVHYSSPTGFFDDLKSIFTGTNANASSLTSSLNTMGLSDEEVQYYTDAYNNGNAIVAVNAVGREQEISNILDQYGAYGTAVKPHYHRGVTNPLEQPATPATYEASDVYASSEHQIADQQPGYVAPEIDAADPAAPAQPELPPAYEAAQEPQASTAITDYSTADQSATDDTIQEPQASTATGDYEAIDQSATTYDAANEAQNGAAMSDYSIADQLASDDTVQEPEASTVTGDYEATDQAMQPAQDMVDTTATEVEQPATQNDTTETYEYAVVDQSEQQTSVETPTEDQPASSQAEDLETPTYQTEEQSAPLTATPVDTVQTEEQSAPPTATPVDTVQTEEQSAPPTATPVDTVTEYQATQVEESVPTLESVTPFVQVGAAPSGSSSKLEELLQQVQAMRQQLEETKARLQAAKEHEAQLQTVRQQMQELQQELESTQAELHETESRLQQY